MRSFIAVAVLVLSLVSLSGAQVSTVAGAGINPNPPESRATQIVGTMYDLGGMWVTDFVLPSGLIVTVPHDPALAGITILTLPPLAPFAVPDITLGDWINNDDTWGLPVIVGSGHCWLVPQGPPNPDGSFPMLPVFMSHYGKGGTIEEAVSDYKSTVAAALAAGLVPSAGACS